MEILIFNIYTYYLLVKEQLIFMSSIIEIHSDTFFLLQFNSMFRITA